MGATSTGSLWMEWDLEGAAEEGLEESDLDDFKESEESWRCCLNMSKRRKPFDMMGGIFCVGRTLVGRWIILNSGSIILSGGVVNTRD